MQRLCTAAEVKFYGDSLLQVAEAAAGGKISRGTTFIAPNKNCNLSAWPSGCEPGWACGTGTSDQVDLKSKTIPTRISNCGPCCAGFFCPPGLTCMIREFLKTSITWSLLWPYVPQNLPMFPLSVFDFFLKFFYSCIPAACPLGSYCPTAKLNRTTGVCDPLVICFYSYIWDKHYDLLAFNWYWSS